MANIELSNPVLRQNTLCVKCGAKSHKLVSLEVYGRAPGWTFWVMGGMVIAPAAIPWTWESLLGPLLVVMLLFIAMGLIFHVGGKSVLSIRKDAPLCHKHSTWLHPRVVLAADGLVGLLLMFVTMFTVWFLVEWIMLGRIPSWGAPSLTPEHAYWGIIFAGAMAVGFSVAAVYWKARARTY